MTTTQLRLTTIVRAGGLITGVAGVGTLLLGVIEYRDQAETARAAETIHMIDRWEDRNTGILAAYQSLSRRVTEVLRTRPAATEPGQSPDEVVASLVSAVLDQDGAREEFEKVVYFFSRLELCVEARQCDERTSAIFFSDTVDTFMRNFRGAILERRSMDPHFGSDIRSLQIRLNRSAARVRTDDPGPLRP